MNQIIAIESYLASFVYPKFLTSSIFILLLYRYMILHHSAYATHRFLWQQHLKFCVQSILCNVELKAFSTKNSVLFEFYSICPHKCKKFLFFLTNPINASDHFVFTIVTQQAYLLACTYISTHRVCVHISVARKKKKGDHRNKMVK